MSPHFQSEIKIIKTSLDRFLALRQLGPLERVRTPNFDQSQTANQNYNLFRLRPHVTQNYDKLSISKLHFFENVPSNRISIFSKVKILDGSQ